MLNNSAAHIIHESAQRGYYVAISDILDLHLSSTDDLSEIEASVWRHLYRQARFSANLSCKQTREQIANGTRLKQVSTYKVTKRLNEKGYLNVELSKDGLNTYALKLPEAVLNELKNVPARGEGVNSLLSTALLTPANTQPKASQSNVLPFVTSKNAVAIPTVEQFIVGLTPVGFLGVHPPAPVEIDHKYDRHVPSGSPLGQSSESNEPEPSKTISADTVPE